MAWIGLFSLSVLFMALHVNPWYLGTILYSQTHENTMQQVILGLRIELKLHDQVVVQHQRSLSKDRFEIFKRRSA